MLSKLLLFALLALPVMALEVKDGYCEQGGQQVIGPGNQASITRVQRSYPSCTVTVTLSAGGMASVFSDSTGTPLANPFTASANGYYFFFIAPSIHFDVTISGGGLAGPITHSYYILGSGSGGGGTLTSVNGQGGPAVTIAPGSTGTDFSIAQAGNTITLNLPSSSASNRGLLLAADWSAFNSKESALTFNSPLSRATNSISLTTVGISLGGTGQTTKAAGFDALSPTTTKGDISVFNGANNARLAVGTNNSCLIADSSQATGLRYDATCHMAIGGIITSSTSGSLLYVSAGQLAQALMSGGGTQCVQVDNSGVPSGTGSPCPGSGSNIVKTDQSNAYTTGIQDFRNATAFYAPVGAGATSTVNGGLVYDSTSNNLHAGINLTDRILIFRSTTPFTPGNCLQAAGLTQVSDTGAPCGSGGSGITTLTGDVTAGPGSGSQAATVVNLPSGVTQAGFLLATNIAAPGTPAGGKGTIYIDNASKNLSVKDDAGVIKHGVQTDTGAANNYISAISDAGAITKSRPACATLSDSGTGCSAAAGITQLTGDVTAGAGSGSQAATVHNLPTGTTQAGYLAITAIAAPGTPGAGIGRFYEDVASKNIAIKDDAGIVKHGVQTKAPVASNFLTAISDAGGVTAAQPAIADLSDGTTVVKGAAGLTNASAIPRVSSGGTLAESKLSCTGTPVTCTLYDDTASTGKSLMALRLGAAQSNHSTCLDRLFTWYDTNGTSPLSLVDCAGSFAVTDWNDGYKKKVAIGSNSSGVGTPPGLNLSSSGMNLWKNVDDLDAVGSYDTGLCRGAAGQLNVNDGSATCTNLENLAAANLLLGASPPACTGGTSGGQCATEGTAPTGAASVDDLYADAAAHRWKMINNNGTPDTVAGAATVDIWTNKTYDTAGAGNVFKINGTAITAVSGTGAVCLATGSSCGGSGSGGTVVPKTTNYTLLSTDSGNIFTFNGSSITATLVATAPTMPWIVGIKNLNASDLTVARNGNTINGGTSNIVLKQYQEMSCESDTVTANNYVCTTPLLGSATITVTPSAIGQTFSIPSSVALAGSPTTTTQAANDNSTKIATTAYVDTSQCTTTITTGTTATLSTCFTVNQEATAGTGVTYTLPTASVSPKALQFCIDSGWNGSAADTGVLTLATSASGQFLVFTDGTLSATGGNVTSGGAARDGACVYAIDSTHWMFLPHSGVWTKH